MGLDSMDTNPIPHLTSPLKGEEQGKLVLMRLRGNDGLMNYLSLCHLRAKCCDHLAC